jgi:hypothetical protein
LERRMQGHAQNLYSRLNASQKEIRVLTLSPIPRDDGPIRCRLSTRRLEDGADFIPLSYVWGDASQTTEIFVNDVSFQATLNLVAFFRHYKFLPNEYQKKAIWVDAICINQSDLAERGQQVALMAKIYGTPEVTISWLGPASEEERSELAIKWIHRIFEEIFEAGDIRSMIWLEKYASDLLKGTAGATPVWSSIASLLRRSYWSRVWTLQETVLPKENVFLCGAYSFPLSQLLWIFRALDYLSTEGQNMLNQSLSSAPRDEHSMRRALASRGSILQALGFQSVQIINLLKTAQDEPSQSDGDSTYVNAPFRAWRVAYLMRTLHAKDARDYIYGAMGMCPSSLISIDYAKTERQLFVEHTAMVINNIPQRQQGIVVTTVLSITGHKIESSLLRNIRCLPSWIPNWGDFDMESQFWLDSYSAGGLKTLTINAYRPGPVAAEGILSLSGVSCSEIQFLQERNNRSLFQFIMAVLTDFYTLEHPLNERFQEFLRVLIRDLDSKKIGKGRIAPNDSKTFLEYACALVVYLLYDPGSGYPQDEDEEDTRRLYGVNMWYESAPRYSRGKEDLRRLFGYLGLDSKGGVADDFWDSLFQHELPPREDGDLPFTRYESFVNIASERLMAIKSFDMMSKKNGETIFRTIDGHLGSTFGEILPGDLICVLYGCNLPVVLRKVDDHFLNIGTCFVLGLMDGEAIKDIEYGKLGVKEFNIH